MSNKKEIILTSELFESDGFDIKRVANGFIVTPWGWPDSVPKENIYVFNTHKQVCIFISRHAPNFQISPETDHE